MLTDGVNYEGLISAVMLLLSAITLPLSIYWTVKYKRGDELFARRFATYFDEFKGTSITYALYYPMFHIRRIFYAIGMNYFEDYPLLQFIVNTSCLLYTSPSPRDS